MYGLSAGVRSRETVGGCSDSVQRESCRLHFSGGRLWCTPGRRERRKSCKTHRECVLPTRGGVAAAVKKEPVWWPACECATRVFFFHRVVVGCCVDIGFMGVRVVACCFVFCRRGRKRKNVCHNRSRLAALVAPTWILWNDVASLRSATSFHNIHRIWALGFGFYVWKCASLCTRYPTLSTQICVPVILR